MTMRAGKQILKLLLETLFLTFYSLYFDFENLNSDFIGKEYSS